MLKSSTISVILFVSVSMVFSEGPRGFYGNAYYEEEMVSNYDIYARKSVGDSLRIGNAGAEYPAWLHQVDCCGLGQDMYVSEGYWKFQGRLGGASSAWSGYYWFGSHGSYSYPYNFYLEDNPVDPDKRVR